MAIGPFEVVWEVEPPTRPDLMHVRHQIGVLSKVASAFLIPDNHIGRATVSSVAVAHEVERMGGRSIACINARDRNLLGLRRDLLTAAAYGVDQFLLVHGDRPTSGEPNGGAHGPVDDGGAALLPGDSGVPDRPPVPGRRHNPSQASSGLEALRRLPLVQVSFSLPPLLRWRETVDFDGPVYVGVMVLASAPMARKLAADFPEMEVPQVVDRCSRERCGGGRRPGL